MTREINATGPKCDWCGCRPDDPMWVQIPDQDNGLACLGCVATVRQLGGRVRILGRAIFARDDSSLRDA